MPRFTFPSSRLPGAPCAASIDISGITDTIQRALAAAGLDPRGGAPERITATIRQALSAAGLNGRTAHPAYDDAAAATRAEIDVTPVDDERTDAAASGTAVPEGVFTRHEFAASTGARAYKLYVPSGCANDPHTPRPLLVMLHGCTQSADDFAAGTRMNALAEAHGFLVAYPEQAPSANGSRCWNWFREDDQRRDRGEPAVLAGIVGEVIARHAIDARRIFVAGLSAGAAMAVILGATYPELFAAVGAHSGLPYGAARDVPSAFAAMQGTVVPKGDQAGARRARDVPTIVFHGDSDATVHGRNGAAIVAEATAERADTHSLHETVERGTAPGGRSYRRTIYADAAGQAVVEEWIVHGAGHAWSGGSSNGSFTDAAGPDASAAMVRFFLARQRGGTA